MKHSEKQWTNFCGSYWNGLETRSYSAYRSSDGEDGHRDLGDVFPVPQVYGLEEIHVRNSVSDTRLLEPATRGRRPLSKSSLHTGTSLILYSYERDKSFSK